MAFAELRCAMAERDPRLEMIKVGPDWASLRGDPRFEAAVTAIGLPP